MGGNSVPQASVVKSTDCVPHSLHSYIYIKHTILCLFYKMNILFLCSHFHGINTTTDKYVQEGFTTSKKHEENNNNKDIFLPGRRGQMGV